MFRGTAGQASLRLQELALNIDKGIMPTRVVAEPEPVAAPVLLSEVLDRWLKHKTKNRKARIRTVRNYEWLLANYVKPVLGSKPVTEITELHVQDLYNGLLERGISAKTIRNLHKVLEPALTRAVGWGLVPENPSLHVELPVSNRKEAKYLTLEQSLSFLAAARQDKWYAALLIAIETGARPNEYLALRWSDIDFNNHSLSIRRSLYWPAGGGFEFTKPETQRSDRTITISGEAIEALRQHKRRQLEEQMRKGGPNHHELGLIFATEEGTPLLWRNLARRHLKPLLTAADIPHDGFSLYSLRHTAASLLVANGETFRVIAERLGTSTTMIDITYSHVPQTLQQTASDRLARVLHGT